MKTELKPTYLKDYQPPAFLVDFVELHVELDPGETRVQSRLSLRANPDRDERSLPLVLHGRNLKLIKVLIDGRELDSREYQLDSDTLTISQIPDRCVIETVVEINPAGNTALEGLYLANGIYCTQCEPQGFRKITFYPDRPDVMSRFKTTLVADIDRAPVLLSNGNLVGSGSCGSGRHYATYEDPFLKPSYLFAMVAGPLALIEDGFTSMSGRQIKLQLFVEERNRYQVDHAMAALIKAMRWDEETYGLEYDLDEYKIVAVDDFNMGAMENKGLNVFNSKYVLAQPETATDADYQGIESVVAHEYFHNWTGNRVTCRDWFQLSLKEGLTVFRDQEFSADMGSRAVKRISDVRLLRNVQFPEDAGPMAHPVRPDSYIEINNFYTATVYNKGAEVIRMYQSLLGADGFRQGLQRYLERHDGQAVTTDDFLAAMADANKIDLSQFQLWYSQDGTPLLDIHGTYDPEACEFRLHVKQTCPSTPRQAEKKPFLIPLKIGLLGPTGDDLPLQLAGESPSHETTRTLLVTTKEQTFDFVNVDVEPIPSLLRGFSAPVKIHYPYTRQDLAYLFAHDQDDFNRWEAGQRLATDVILEMVADFEDGWAPEFPDIFLQAFRSALTDRDADPALLALALTLPAEAELAEAMGVADPVGIHAVRTALRRALAEFCEDDFRQVLHQMTDHGLYSPDAESIGRRSLKNLCISYLTLLPVPQFHEDCFSRFAEADNMTDRMAALTCLVHNRLPKHDEALAAFYHQFQNAPLVVDKWFTLQATAPGQDTLRHVQALRDHPAFTMRNPNRVRSLIGAFAHANPAVFHDLSGEGYLFVADAVLELDETNPQVAARLLGPLSRWRSYEHHHQKLMCKQLERIRQQEQLSNDVGEIITRSLADF